MSTAATKAPETVTEAGTDTATDTATTAPGTATDSGSDRPVLTPEMGIVVGPEAAALLTDEQLADLEDDCCTVLGAVAVDGGVVAVVAAADDRQNVGASIQASPRDLLTGDAFGGSGELLLPEDSCNFETTDDGWTVVVTRAPTAAVTLVVGGAERTVDAAPMTVDGQEIGVVFVEGGLAQDGPRPTADPGGEC